ncbi:hypothetical protein [Pseudomonas aeruginosa]|uniref:hypothetical protein n=1 Tax=Pseudomonas aeruginosa TaxID=287 RepID=UPI002E2C4D2E|nr:hypothetical protein [Pseudomonas aeruginosa]
MLVKYLNKRKPSEIIYFSFGFIAIIIGGIFAAKFGLNYGTGVTGIFFLVPASIVTLYSIFLIEALIVLKRKIFD